MDLLCQNLRFSFTFRCCRLGLVSLAYLWQRDQADLLREMIDAGVKAVLIKVASMGIQENWSLILGITSPITSWFCQAWCRRSILVEPQKTSTLNCTNWYDNDYCLQCDNQDISVSVFTEPAVWDQCLWWRRWVWNLHSRLPSISQGDHLVRKS